jgi:hypothetical protein
MCADDTNFFPAAAVRRACGEHLDRSTNGVAIVGAFWAWRANGVNENWRGARSARAPRVAPRDSKSCGFSGRNGGAAPARNFGGFAGDAGGKNSNSWEET